MFGQPTTFGHLAAQDPAAAGLVAVCAFLAPEPVPAAWFPRAAAGMPDSLAEAAARLTAAAHGCGREARTQGSSTLIDPEWPSDLRQRPRRPPCRYLRICGLR
jgi:hypothetical protein